MKEIKKIHNEAINLVKQANIVLEKGDRMSYLSLIEQAYFLEKEAAYELDSLITEEPTRSVLFRSAANLAFLCGKYEEYRSCWFFSN